MKKNFTFCFLFAYTVTTGQDTIYLDENFKEITQNEATYYRIDEHSATGDQDLIRRTYRLNGEIYRKRSFLEKGDKLILHGLQKTWYENGQLFYQENYKKGKRNGDLTAFWEDGSKRRHDFFKKGKLKSGKVWNRKGQEEEHFPVMISARFPGGQKAIATYLRDNLPVSENQKPNTEVRLLVRLRVNKEGFIDTIDIHRRCALLV